VGKNQLKYTYLFLRQILVCDIFDAKDKTNVLCRLRANLFWVSFRLNIPTSVFNCINRNKQIVVLDNGGSVNSPYVQL